MIKQVKMAVLLLTGMFVAVFVFIVTTLVTVGSGHYIFMAVLFPAQTDFTKGVPDNFMVVLEDKAAQNIDQTFSVRYWNKENFSIPELAKKHPEMFRLSVREPPGGGRWFKVIEESTQHQVIEVRHDNTYMMHLRYKVEGDRITPLYYKIDASMGASLYFLPIVAICMWLGSVAARRSVRWVKPAVEAVRRT